MGNARRRRFSFASAWIFARANNVTRIQSKRFQHKRHSVPTCSEPARLAYDATWQYRLTGEKSNYRLRITLRIENQVEKPNILLILIIVEDAAPSWHNDLSTVGKSVPTTNSETSSRLTGNLFRYRFTYRTVENIN